MAGVGRPKGKKDSQPRKITPHGRPYPVKFSPNVKDVVEKNEKKEEISRIVGESVQFFGSPRVRNNVELADRLNEYFDICWRTGQIPTVEDMALALGINRRTLRQWRIEVERDPERAELCTQAMEVLAAIDAKLVSEGKIPQVTYIFRAKNYFDMHDQTEMLMTAAVDPWEDHIDIEKVKQKYFESAYEGEKVPELPKGTVEVVDP